MWLPMLMTCLHDPDRFAAAHVYLKLIQGELLPTSSEEWQGLHVEVLPDGGGKYDPSDQEKLLREWKEWRQLRGRWSSFNE
jgi:hypothetical protein